MTPQQLHAILGQALRESGPAAMLHPAAAWPVFHRVCVPAARALRAGELYFWWGTDEEAGYRRFYVKFRCTQWWVKEPWREDSECDLWWVDLAFARPADPASDSLGSGEHECLDVEDPGSFAPAVEALGVLSTVERLNGWTMALTWERDNVQD